MADLITRQAAIDVLDRNHILGQGLLNDTLDHIADAIMALPSAQPDSKELSFTQKKLDTISRQAAIRWVKTECNPYGKPTLDFESGKKVIEHLKQMPSAQPETHEKRTETHACDYINRKDAIDAVYKCADIFAGDMPVMVVKSDAYEALAQLPSAQPTLHGYNIEHLELIARVLQKENLPPERVVEALTDIGRIVAIVSDEFNETLRKAVEQCMT